MAYKPNNIPLTERIISVLLSCFLLVYGGYGVYKNDIAIPTKTGVMHFHNGPALMHYGAFICAVLMLLSLVVDHYDKRNNEKTYKVFQKRCGYIGCLLFIVSVFWQIFY